MGAVSFTILSSEDGESWGKLLARIRKADGELLVVLSAGEKEFRRDAEEIRQFLAEVQHLSGSIRIAIRHRKLALLARRQGIRVIDRTADLQSFIAGHPNADEALRAFHPQVWRQQLRSRLQSMGLLSMPKLRIWILVATSAVLFYLVLFRLLPSATVRIVPREDPISHTVNIFLVQSGTTVPKQARKPFEKTPIPSRVRTMELRPITVELEHTVTFDKISKVFSGENARVPMTIVNGSPDRLSLKKGSRLANQAGMVFRTQEGVDIEAGGRVTVLTVADEFDLYHEVIGERGNVPVNLKWTFPSLDPPEHDQVYGMNDAEARGGRTAYRTVLSEEDLTAAAQQLRQELLALAKRQVDEERLLFNSRNEAVTLEILYYEELTLAEFHGFDLPEEFLGTEIATVPVSGAITYTVYAFDNAAVLRLLTEELLSHIGQGKRLLMDSVGYDRLVPHVINYEDDLSWIKLTVDLTGTEQFILDPLTPFGAFFARQVRTAVLGLPREEALHVIENYPEVRSAGIALWPPWSRKLPGIPAHIYVDAAAK